MEHFETFLEDQLRPVIEFLRQKWSRDLFVALCLMTGSGKWQAHLFDSFDASLADWRWHTLLSSITKLLQVEKPLRDNWNAEKMNHVKARRRQDPQDAGAADLLTDGREEAEDDPGNPGNAAERGEEADEDEEGEALPTTRKKIDKIDLTKVSAAILDPFFWAYCRNFL